MIRAAQSVATKRMMMERLHDESGAESPVKVKSDEAGLSDVNKCMENLNEAILELGESNCASADLCLAMGSSLRVSPANGMPQACAMNGGNLVIVNL